MDVFISWSGARSQAAAKALRDWLPMIINALNPWVSSDDIGQGTRWSVDIATNLGKAKAGIICLTPSNLHNDWILFEAGRLSKSIENTYVCPLLIDLQPADITGPLAQFQATTTSKEHCLKLVTTLNNALAEEKLKDAQVKAAFEKWWPDLEQQLNALPSDESTPPTARSPTEILDELLSLARSSARDIDTIAHSLPDPEIQGWTREKLGAYILGGAPTNPLPGLQSRTTGLRAAKKNAAAKTSNSPSADTDDISR